MAKQYWAHILTGGAEGALDNLINGDGTNLADLDMALVVTANMAHIFSLDADSAASENSPSVIALDTNGGDKRFILVGLTLPNTGLHLLDTNASHYLIPKWNENDTANRTLNLLLNSGDRTLDLSENLTVADGYNVTLQALGQANSLILNESLTVGDGNDGTITFSAASKVVTVAGSCTLNDWFDQAVKAASNVSFGTIGCGTITVADGSSISLQEDITFTGATTVNQVKFPDNLANALSFQEGTNIYQQFITTNGSEAVSFPKKIGLGTTSPTGFFHAKLSRLTDLTNGASASAESTSGAYTASKVIDDDIITVINNHWGANGAAPKWWKVDLGSNQLVTSYRIFPNQVTSGWTYTNFPKDWTLEGSTNDSDWDVLDTQATITWVSQEWQAFSFVNSTQYRYYRITITATHTAARYVALGQVELYEEDVTVEAGVDIDGAYDFNFSVDKDEYVKITEGALRLKFPHPIANHEMTLGLDPVLGPGLAVHTDHRNFVVGPYPGLRWVASSVGHLFQTSAENTTGTPRTWTTRFMVSGGSETPGEVAIGGSINPSNLSGAVVTMKDGNLLVNSYTSPATMDGGMAMALGTPPTGNVANQFAMYAIDQAPGNTCLGISTENGAAIKIYQCAKADYNNWTDFGDVVDALVAMGIFDAA